MSDRGEVITFYSYKGEVGRTMGLANVAYLITRLNPGEKVLMIDFDLEAPGLHRFFKKAEPSKRRGVIELFAELADALNGRAKDVEQVRRVLAGTKIENYIANTGEPGLDLMEAGVFDEYYATKVNEFDWNGLYNHSPLLFKELAELLASRYRFVLIDSRTGVTDTGAICTGLMPEKLVVVFTHDEQSLTGGLEAAEKPPGTGRVRAI